MPTKYHLSHAEQLFYGAAYHPGAFANFGRKGYRVMLPSWVLLGTPIVGDADGYLESQAITAAGGPATGLNGTLGGVADVPRNVVAAWTGTAVMTVTGTDVYGRPLVESSASGTSFTGKKAFKTVTAVSVSADVTGATVGHGDVLGLPYRVNSKDEILIFENGVPVATGTFVAAVTTDPATATTGDVRGTLDPTATLNGSVRIAVQFLNLDPTSKVSLFGVDQYAG